MGGKAPMQSPPSSIPEDVVSASEKAAQSAEKEKEALIGSKRKGLYGTILTSGKGLEEDASTSKTMLGGNNSN